MVRESLVDPLSLPAFASDSRGPSRRGIFASRVDRPPRSPRHPRRHRRHRPHPHHPTGRPRNTYPNPRPSQVPDQAVNLHVGSQTFRGKTQRRN